MRLGKSLVNAGVPQGGGYKTDSGERGDGEDKDERNQGAQPKDICRI